MKHASTRKFFEVKHFSYKPSSLLLPTRLKNILAGSLLGDAHIYKRSLNCDAYISFGQAMKHREYLFHLFELLKDFSGAGPVEVKTLDKRYNKYNHSFHFKTKTLPVFNELADLFLETDGTRIIGKRLPSNIYDLLTPIGLAYWICDDGQAVKKNGITAGVTLCTDSFSYDEVLILKAVLEKKFGFKCSIHTKRYANTYYRVYISKLSMPLLRSLVAEYLHPTMMYKIGSDT
jgi:hypothetical protein